MYIQNAHGVIDARQSSINSLEYNLTNERGKIKELTKRMPSLETRLSGIMEETSSVKKQLEEKTGQLLLTRKQLRVAREKNSVRNKCNMCILNNVHVHVLCNVGTF